MTDYADFNGKIIAEFRAAGGKVGGRFAGSNMLLLHHTGARTGAERVCPLAYQRVGESFADYERTAAPRKIPVIVLDRC
jgi:hypothetical protein